MLDPTHDYLCVRTLIGCSSLQKNLPLYTGPCIARSHVLETSWCQKVLQIQWCPADLSCKMMHQRNCRVPCKLSTVTNWSTYSICYQLLRQNKHNNIHAISSICEELDYTQNSCSFRFSKSAAHNAAPTVLLKAKPHDAIGMELNKAAAMPNCLYASLCESAMACLSVEDVIPLSLRY